ncbi:3'(2'),5'-bisphosphate nucleotidase CysQ [uncultured Streptomyces sp.]|uniref:3'(2'),5'-bisphosphate nucleotidase CysQ n=1 Tax=uncultured Streptomyces sp. TaxID=174707 RepID=UPI00260717BE|nr:3'(2'),5'-bisphosphate nucleotidase CysQ [uncultured Streptomyces sp.]
MVSGGARPGRSDPALPEGGGRTEPLLDGTSRIADDTALAAVLATGAGRVLLALRAEHTGAPPQDLARLGDAGAQRHLAAALRQHRPADAVLSEEGADDAGRLNASRVWIIDPLDGTREFSEAWRSDWAVHVALWEEGRLTAAAVALPERGSLLTTAPVPGPRRRTGPRAEGPGPGRGLRLAVSRSRPPALIGPVARRLDARLVPMGSAGVKIAAVIEGTADAYIHAGGQYEWDSAAPVAVAVARGLHASRIDGSPLRYNQAHPWLPDLVVCHPGDHVRILAALADVTPPATETPS